MTKMASGRPRNTTMKLTRSKLGSRRRRAAGRGRPPTVVVTSGSGGHVTVSFFTDESLATLSVMSCRRW